MLFVGRKIFRQVAACLLDLAATEGAGGGGVG